MSPRDFYKGKTILVTGGAGSIGSQLVRELLKYRPKSVRVFDNNETGLFDLEQDLQSPLLRILVGDVRDITRLNIAFDGVDIVFHASALKHVPLCEFNAIDAIQTNVIGTQNVIEAAIANDVKKVINISTDKAVNPTNVMGATKLLGERLIISASYYSGKKLTVFSNVRFGNVLNSRGSVVPLLLSQIRKGGPVTLTDQSMTRFYMDIPSAVNLIIKAGCIAQGREIFILKMPALKIRDLLEVMIEEYAPLFGYKPSAIQLKLIGKRNGEKLHEDLMTFDDMERAYENNEMFIIYPRIYINEKFSVAVPFGYKKASGKIFSSELVTPATKREIKAVLSKMKIC